ncbi:MAG: multiheme c-type cytochrome [Planctomycetota bacterium]
MLRTNPQKTAVTRIRLLPSLVRMVAAGVLALAGLGGSGGQPVSGQEAARRWEPLTSGLRDWTGTLSCASASCHGQDAETVPGITLGGKALHQESTIWEEHDPHARAARILDTAQFRRILTRVSGQDEDAVFDPVVYRQCAACHDPAGIAAQDAAARQGVAALDRHAAPRGVGCESCHGAAQDWLSSHFQGNFTAERRAATGMTDTRDLLTRGRVCAQCHVGDEQHDMNHDMIAAGHPPLRFELSSYHDLIKVKHWRETSRQQVQELKFQLWLAGRWAVADASLGLLADRARRATHGQALKTKPVTKPDTTAASLSRVAIDKLVSQAAPKQAGVWPEFAEYDCFACHQRLRASSERAVESSGGRAERSAVAATPRWQPWNLSASRGGLLPGSDVKLDQALLELRATLSANLETDSSAIHAQALAARQQLRASLFPGITMPPRPGERVLVDDSVLSGRSTPGGTTAPWSARRYLEQFAKPIAKPAGAEKSGAEKPSPPGAAAGAGAVERQPVERTPVERWADVCQDYLAVKAAYQSWCEGSQRGEPQWERVDGNSVLRSRRSDRELERKLDEIAQSLRFGSSDFEWPGYDWKGLPGEPVATPLGSLSAIREQLQDVAGQLLRRWNGAAETSPSTSKPDSRREQTVSYREAVGR